MPREHDMLLAGVFGDRRQASIVLADSASPNSARTGAASTTGSPVGTAQISASARQTLTCAQTPLPDHLGNHGDQRGHTDRTGARHAAPGGHLLGAAPPRSQRPVAGRVAGPPYPTMAPPGPGRVAAPAPGSSRSPTPRGRPGQPNPHLWPPSGRVRRRQQ
jgi:hypothetical protein